MLCKKCGEEIGDNKNCPFCGEKQNFDNQNNNEKAEKETRICKNCQMEISKKANICPFCRSQQPTNKNIIGIILILTCIAITSVWLWKFLDYSALEEGNQCYITLEKFNKIENGMNYDQVKKIIGCDGSLLSEAQITDDSIGSQMYYWYGKDGISNANFTFIEGKLKGKAQIGLDK